jgi:hypothetical protein
MLNQMNRREFLKLGGATLAGLALPGTQSLQAASARQAPARPLGRIIIWRQPIRAEPAPGAEWITWKYRDEVIPLYEEVTGEAPWPTNPVWYRTEGGFIHSGYVQPVENALQSEVMTEVPESGFWAEVSVPFAEARWRPNSPYVARKLYYQTVYRVVNAVQDEAGEWWYQLKEGITYVPGPYVPTKSVRRIPAGALAPISVGREDKWMQIKIGDQTLTCFEGDNAVFSTRAATGLWRTATPHGEFRVLYKRHTRRMIGGDEGDRYDLPGVPFPVYFTWNGVAIHGTYWHNDYGRRHSHGCVNLSSDAARWVFRWVDPVTTYDTYTEKAEGNGTRVVVVA